MSQPSTSVAYGSVILAAALWGESIVAQKMALTSFSAVEALVLRDIRSVTGLGVRESDPSGSDRVVGPDFRERHWFD